MADEAATEGGPADTAGDLPAQAADAADVTAAAEAPAEAGAAAESADLAETTTETPAADTASASDTASGGETASGGDDAAAADVAARTVLPGAHARPRRADRRKRKGGSPETAEPTVGEQMAVGVQPTDGEHPPSRRHRRWPRVLAAVASAAVLVAASAGAALNRVVTQLEDNVTALDISDQVGTDRPVRPVIDEGGNYSPLNILLMGSDTRQGKNNRGYGKADEITGERSDTTILLHLSADRQHATAVSFPRDTWVTLPLCKDRETKTTVGGYENKFNVAFDLAGPGCTLKLVEQLTGLRVDNFVVVDFGGFKRVIEALNGVEVCLAEPVNDPLSGLDLPKGKSVVNGEQALAFVRARKTLGDGSDLSRIQRQQAFLSSLIRKASSNEILLNPVSLYRFLDEATKSLTTDPELAKIENMRDLALSIRSMKPSQITFLTMPWIPRGDNSNVLINPTAADPVWQAMRDDTPWPPKRGDQPVLTSPPSGIYVEVLNGTSIKGMQDKAADDLRSRGYNVVSTGKADSRDYASSVVRYDPNWDESAKTLTWAVAGATSEPEAGLGGTLTLVVGEDYTEVRKVKIAGGAATDSTAAVSTADEETCAS